MIQLIDFERTTRTFAETTRIWNAAVGAGLAFPPAFMEFNTRPTTGIRQAGKIALDEGRPVGFALASASGGELFKELSTLDVIAVHPDYQHRGIGSMLLEWAEVWVQAAGAKSLRLGASLRPFAPGLPTEIDSLAFFAQKAFDTTPVHYEWDVARSLKDYETPERVRGIPADTRPLKSGEEADLLGFLQREFPGRWLFEVSEFFSSGGRASDFMVLWTGIGIDGFCWTTYPDSARPLERFYMDRLPRPWAQLGPLGVGQGCRGRGLGGALIDAAIRRVQAEGVDGCLIDWTDLLDLYGKFGFTPYRQYRMLSKTFPSQAG